MLTPASKRLNSVKKLALYYVTVVHQNAKARWLSQLAEIAVGHMADDLDQLEYKDLFDSCGEHA